MGDELDNENTGDDDLEDLTTEELMEAVKSERGQKTKISEDYKKVEAERNQYEGVITNLKGSLEESGRGTMHIVDDKVRIEFKDTPTVKQEDKTEVQLIDDEIKKISNKVESGEIEKDAYYKEVARLQGKRAYHEEKAKDQVKSVADNEKSVSEQHNQHWGNKIKGDFGKDAVNADSELMKEMNRIFEADTVGMSEAAKAKEQNDMKLDLGKYYKLAQVAKMNIDSKKNVSRTNPVDEYATLSNDGAGSFGDRSNESSDILSDSDKGFIETRIGKGASKRLSAILTTNKKAGNMPDDDPFLLKSEIHMES